jgi:niacin transporter
MIMPKWAPTDFASFTLASHVPIFIAMMISPAVAVAVAVGTTIGFWFSTTPVIALRAASHLVFVLIGGFYLQRRPETLSSPVQVHVFSFLVAVLHSVCEVGVVSVAYVFGFLAPNFYAAGFNTVVLLLGVGFVIHSMVDFEIALVVFKALSRQPGFAAMSRK